jgi:hypothetical protein
MDNLTWRKSTRSSPNGGQCVEVARGDGRVMVRDSKDYGGPELHFDRTAWSVFIGDVKR